MAFKPATRKKLKARIALCGPPKSGKTLTALKLARHFARGGRIGVIDSEHESASLYCDQVPFDSDDIRDYSVENYISKIDDAAREGFPVLIIDSLSHAWEDLLDFVNTKTSGSKSQNSFTEGWKHGTPLQNKLIEAILSFPGHVIVTLRTKMAYEIEERNGMKVPVRVGTKPIQRSGIEYEFTIIGDMREGTMTVTGTRCSAIAGGVYYHPGEELAGIILDWLENGIDDPNLHPVGEDEMTTAIASWPTMTDADFQASTRALQARIVRHRQPKEVFTHLVLAAKEEHTRRTKGKRPSTPSVHLMMEPNGEEAAAELERADMVDALDDKGMLPENSAPHEADEEAEREALDKQQKKTTKKESKQ